MNRKYENPFARSEEEIGQEDIPVEEEDNLLEAGASASGRKGRSSSPE